MAFNLKIRFLVVVVALFYIYGTYLYPMAIAYASSPDVTPFMAALTFYSLVYSFSLVLLYALFGEWNLHLTKLALLGVLIYTLTDWAEPPSTINPDGSLALDAPGARASLDYSIGYYIHEQGYSWKQTYDIEQWLVPVVIGLAIISLAPVQTLSIALQDL